MLITEEVRSTRDGRLSQTLNNLPQQKALLQRIFPHWNTLDHTFGECDQCIDSQGKRKDEVKSLKLAAEREKVRRGFRE